MLLQGHWKRVNTPLRATTTRERRILLVFAGLLTAAVIGAVIVAIGSSSPKTPAGCARIEAPSTMGGGSSLLCGSTLRSFCGSPAAHNPPLNATVLPKC